MKVKAIDGLCGVGKTRACYAMINEASDGERFVFITPYLDEVDELIRECPGKNFKQPVKLPTKDGGSWSKLNGLHKLLEDGENIASTHALFTIYTEETIELIKRYSYNLVIDETVDILEQVGSHKAGDIEMIVRNNITTIDQDDKVTWNDSEYKDGSFDEIKALAMSGNLYLIGKQFYKYLVKKDVLESFKSVYMMTYMFEHQPIRLFLEVNHIDYEIMGVKVENGVYKYCSLNEMDRKRDIRDRIEILDNKKLNMVGDGYHSLSSNWFEKRTKKPKDYDNNNDIREKYKESNHKDIAQLRNNAVNFFVNHCPSASDERMWSCVKRFEKDLSKKGYVTAFVPYNQRAIESLHEKRFLVYCTNIFPNPVITGYFERHGARPLNDEMYAIAVASQWIFRSALRREDGGAVTMYVPSQRMRYLLNRWVKKLAEGRDLDEISSKEVMRECKINKSDRRLCEINNKLREIKRELRKESVKND